MIIDGLTFKEGLQQFDENESKTSSCFPHSHINGFPFCGFVAIFVSTSVIIGARWRERLLKVL